ncbi:MAG: restriction endonuclease, partial [Bacteroidaceae bacterium]|nr:restriction endonuclease [Bacteroidaceae bacterium]
MLAFTIITITIIFSIILYNKTNQKEQKEFEAKQKEKRKQQELKSKQEEKRMQKELKTKEEEERKQKELKAKEEEKRKAWARKMAEARLQKKLQKEKEEAEYLENKRKYCIQLENELNSIGVSFIVTKEFCYDIFAPENIELKKTLCLLKELSLKQIFRTLNQRFYIQHNFFITDLNNEKLIEILEFDEESCGLYFYQEDREEIEFNKGNAIKQAEDFLFCYLENRKIMRLENSLGTIILNGINQAPKLLAKGNSIEEKICSALESSNYGIDFRKEIESIKEKDMLVVNYELPNMSNFSEVKEYKYIASSKEIRTKTYTESYIAKRYENVLYSITLRSLYEIFSIDTENEINGVTFNGFVAQVNPATGIIERKCILSLQVDRQKFSQINLSHVEPKACFKALKGVSAAKLIDISPITPILTFNKKDRRFVEGKDVEVNQGTNLAAMHWEDFEHLVRELFEMEFARNGGEVRVTQASRDGGVDAIVFDPDPLRGGKIVIQAKRYTNTVGVSAVRD